MTRFLLATDSVHTTAAACDYLADRLTADDTVRVVGVEAAAEARGPVGDVGEPRAGDAADAVNVATARLVVPTVESAVREGDPVAELRAEIEAGDVDELLLGARRPRPGPTEGLGSVARALLGHVDVPAVVLPPIALD